MISLIASSSDLDGDDATVVMKVVSLGVSPIDCGRVLLGDLFWERTRLEFDRLFLDICQ
jgi:hypothetical protein